MLKIGLTGGIGSGKSLVGKIFAMLDVSVYQSDMAAKRLYDSDNRLREELVALFGKNIYSNSGKLDRTRLAEIVFADSKNLEKINALVHPAVIDDFEHYAASFDQSVPYLIHESAILYEAGLEHLFNAVINVYAPEDLRIKRIVSRGADINDAQRRIAAQLPDKIKIERADYNIVNDDKHLILPQIINIHKILSNKIITQL
ncbi:MAG: dephospho-CoA kinase [Prevotellaceae bacterium]|jgi:dephospho-CoA kinase|nr:dephospho-CoA kinase [Prevotellaceae bacterium]